MTFSKVPLPLFFIFFLKIMSLIFQTPSGKWKAQPADPSINRKDLIPAWPIKYTSHFTSSGVSLLGHWSTKEKWIIQKITKNCQWGQKLNFFSWVSNKWNVECLIYAIITFWILNTTNFLEIAFVTGNFIVLFIFQFFLSLKRRKNVDLLSNWVIT